MSITNAMTIDVEDYFQVSAFEDVIDRSEWENIPSRIPENIEKILLLLERHNTRATFFTLGW
ncbi:MAG: polysaccharide deacetylase family protein, partial [Gammaproteobacteria bacterium]|nr:polysaccharide deacetylase family protein [Gammaproteobacteria bacterium]